VAEVVAEAGGPLFNHRLDLHLSNDHKASVISHFKNSPPQAIAGIPVKEIGLKDGVKLYLDGGSWVLLRPSGTEPLMRVYMETTSDAQQEAIAREMQAIIKTLEA